MTYEQATAFLDSRIGTGWKLGLDSIRRLLDELENPHKRIRAVHIAGTNGKGSTCAMLESIFRTAGYRTGLYTSPHLLDVRERIQINRQNIPPGDFARVMQRIAPLIEKYAATYFETLTVLAFVYFAEENLDVAFIEVGLGGRLDATNVIHPELSIITSIDFDHMQHLGDTLEKIAAEKAGIVKNGVDCLAGKMPDEADKVITSVCEKHHAPFYRAADFYDIIKLDESPGKTKIRIAGSQYRGDMVLALNGKPQLDNAAIALAGCDLLSCRGYTIDFRHVQLGMRAVNWPGRLQVVSENPTVVLDVAHNKASFDKLIESLVSLYGDKKIYFVIGLMEDKSIDAIVEKTAGIAYAVQPVAADDPRAMTAQELHGRYRGFSAVLYDARTVRDGVLYVLNQCEKDALVCITGSHYIAGDALRAIKGLTN